MLVGEIKVKYIGKNTIICVPDTICADHFLIQNPSWLAGDLQIQPETQEGREKRKGWQHQVGWDSRAPLDEQKQKIMFTLFSRLYNKTQ